MRNKLLILSLLIFGVGGGVYFYFSKSVYTGGRVVLSDWFPNEVAFVLDFENVFTQYEKLELMEVWRWAKKDPLFSDIGNLEETWGQIRDCIERGNVGSIHGQLGLIANSQGALEPLLIMDPIGGWAFDEHLQDCFPEVTLSSHSYKGETYNSVDFGNGQTFTYYANNSALVVSRRPALVEAAIDASKKAMKFSSFIQRELGLGQSLFVNFSQAQSFLGSLVRLPSELAHMVSFDNGYGAFSVFASDGKIDIGGSFQLLTSEHLIGKKIDFNCLDLVTDKAVFLAAYTRGFNERFDSLKSLTMSIDQEMKFGFTDDLLTLLGKESGLGIIPYSNPNSDQKFAFVELIELERAEELLKLGAFPDTTTSSEVVRLKTPMLGQLLFGNWFDTADVLYGAMVDHFLFFSTEEIVVREMIHSHYEGRVLSNSFKFGNVSPNLIQNANLLMFAMPDEIKDVEKKVGYSGLPTFFNRNSESIAKLGLISFKIESSANGGFVHFNTRRKEIEQSENKLRQLWRVQLDTGVQSGPFRVYNHHSQAFNFLVCDLRNKLHCYSHSGQELWSRTLDGPVRGRPFEVDLYKNNKIQYVLGTETSVYVIDRLGRDVMNYPVSPESKMNTPIGVFDVAGDRTYQIISGCENGQILALNGNGTPMDGWAHVELDTTLSLPVQYCQSNEFRGFFAQDHSRKLHFWRGDGSSAYPSVLLDAAHLVPYAVQKDVIGSLPVFESVDSSGRITSVSPTGKTSSKRIGNWVGVQYFQMLDMDSDQTLDYLFIKDNRITGYRSNETLLMNLTTRDKVTYAKVVSRQPFLLFYELSGSEGFLIDQNGKVLGRFPVSDVALLADLDKDGKRDLVGVYQTQTIVAYKLK